MKTYFFYMFLAILITTTSNSTSQTIELKKENKVKILEKNLKKQDYKKI